MSLDTLLLCVLLPLSVKIYEPDTALVMVRLAAAELYLNEPNSIRLDAFCICLDL